MIKRYNKKQKILHLTSILGLIIATWCCQLIARPHNEQPHNQTGTEDKNSPRSNPVTVVSNNNACVKDLKLTTTKNTTNLSVPGLDRQVLRLAVKAYNNAKSLGLNPKDYLTIVDYSMPSSKRRMWILDMSNKKVLHHTHVAHGAASGENLAHKFSNIHGSHMSSLGTFVTGKTYSGRFGQALELHGLDDEFNSNAYARRIVVHAADYANENVINKIGRLGRSQGCLSLNTSIAKEVIRLIKNGSLIFCYYPDANWLFSSKLLKS